MTHRTFVDHTPESAPDGSRAALVSAARKFGHVPAPLARMAESPSAVAAFHDGLAHFARSSLDPTEREVVVFAVATRHRCHYCVALHSFMLSKAGADDTLLDALRTERTLPSARLEALRRFAKAVLDTQGDVGDAARDAFFDAGFDARHALDVVVGIATYTLSTFANRLTRAELDPSLDAFRWDPVATERHLGR